MRKRSKYRPKGVRIDALAYVMSGIKKFDDVSEAITVRIKNHAAMDALRKGQATKEDIDVLIGAFNMVEAFSRLRDNLGSDWTTEIREAQDALLAIARRGVERGSFICWGSELVSLNLAMQLHDAQLDEVTVQDMERALDIIEKEIRSGQARPIVKLTVAA
jgi:hypothetical protein